MAIQQVVSIGVSLAARMFAGNDPSRVRALVLVWEARYAEHPVNFSAIADETGIERREVSRLDERFQSALLLAAVAELDAISSDGAPLNESGEGVSQNPANLVYGVEDDLSDGLVTEDDLEDERHRFAWVLGLGSEPCPVGRAIRLGLRVVLENDGARLRAMAMRARGASLRVASASTGVSKSTVDRDEKRACELLLPAMIASDVDLDDVAIGWAVADLDGRDDAGG